MHVGVIKNISEKSLLVVWECGVSRITGRAREPITAGEWSGGGGGGGAGRLYSPAPPDPITRGGGGKPGLSRGADRAGSARSALTTTGELHHQSPFHKRSAPPSIHSVNAPPRCPRYQSLLAPQHSRLCVR